VERVTGGCHWIVDDQRDLVTKLFEKFSYAASNSTEEIANQLLN
jgi:hypothetical protein